MQTNLLSFEIIDLSGLTYQGGTPSGGPGCGWMFGFCSSTGCGLILGLCRGDGDGDSPVDISVDTAIP